VPILQYSNKTIEKSNIEKLIGIFRGKQATYNKIILDALYNNGALSSWEIAGRITGTERKHSLNATLFKRLQKLEKKGYVSHVGRKWTLQYKGIIASLLIQEKPKPLSKKWSEPVNEFSKLIKSYENLQNMNIQINNTIIPLSEIIDESLKTLTFSTPEDWITLSAYYKELIQKGTINLDVISNQTLAVIFISEQLNTFIKNWNSKNVEKQLKNP